MPEISRFYALVIKMYFDDHQPAHFHAEYGGQELLIAIDTLAIIAGGLSPRAMGLVTECIYCIQSQSSLFNYHPHIH